ncbi:hypothetical protein DIPPA_19268 [Diplonema papillatum]|nr:hypothetical protein DIPPA_19268 [Diplonema papillatum]
MTDYVKVSEEAGGGFLMGEFDWGTNGGKCWEFWDCQPCLDGYCCVTWLCCGCMNTFKMYAWSLDQECALLNHCLPFMCPCTPCVMRHATRKKAGAVNNGPAEGVLADCLCTICCGPCTFGQELRAAHIMGGKDSWDFFGNPHVQLMDEWKYPPFM